MSVRAKKRRAKLRRHGRHWLELMAADYARIEPMPGESNRSLRGRVRAAWSPPRG